MVQVRGSVNPWNIPTRKSKNRHLSCYSSTHKYVENYLCTLRLISYTDRAWNFWGNVHPSRVVTNPSARHKTQRTTAAVVDVAGRLGRLERLERREINVPNPPENIIFGPAEKVEN